MTNILLVKLSSLGDVIQALHVLPLLKETFDACKISWVVEKKFSGVLHAHPLVDKVYEVDTKKWRKKFFLTKDSLKFFKKFRNSSYDIVFDLQGNSKSALFTLLAKAKEKIGFGKKVVAESTNLLVTTKKFSVDASSPITAQYLELVKKGSQFYQKKQGFSSIKSSFGSTIPSKKRADTSDQSNLLELLLLGSQEKIKKEKAFLSSMDFSKGFMVCFGSMWENKRLSLKTWIDFLYLVQKSYQSDFFLVWGSQKEKEFAGLLKRHLEEKIKKEIEHKDLSDSLATPHISIQILDKLNLSLWQNTMKLCRGVIAVDSSALHLAATCNRFSFGIFGPSASSVYAPNKKGSYQGICPYQQTFTKRCKKLRTCSTGACIKQIDAKELFFQFKEFEKSLQI